jgi:hypothetical protein
MTGTREMFHVEHLLNGTTYYHAIGFGCVLPPFERRGTISRVFIGHSAVLFAVWRVILLRSFIVRCTVLLSFGQFYANKITLKPRGFNITFDLSKISLSKYVIHYDSFKAKETTEQKFNLPFCGLSFNSGYFKRNGQCPFPTVVLNLLCVKSCGTDNAHSLRLFYQNK